MPLQTSGAISLNDIATEFGGTTPHSISEYYRGGSFVPSGPSQNANIPTSGQISFSQFYGATKIGTAINPLGFNGGTYVDDGTGLFNASISLSMKSDGTWEISPSWGSPVSGNWLTPQVGMSSFYVRFTLNSTSGSSSGTTWSASTGWLQLNSNRVISVTCASVSLSRFRDTNYTVEIATDAAGTNIVSTSTVNLNVLSSP